MCIHADTAPPGLYEFNYVVDRAQPVLRALHYPEVAAQLELQARTHVLSSDELTAAAPVEVPFAHEPPGHIPIVGFVGVRRDGPRA